MAVNFVNRGLLSLAFLMGVDEEPSHVGRD